MPTSNLKPLNKRNDSGFSLLEVLVVLAIIGTLLTVVSASFSSTIERIQFVKESRLAVAVIQEHRVEASLTKQARLIITDETILGRWAEYQDNQVYTFPLNNTVDVAGDAIEISASGMCAGGTITLTSTNELKATFVLKSPECKIDFSNS